MEKQIEEFLNYLQLKNKSPLTVRNYRLYLYSFAKFTGNIEPTTITLDMIDQFQSRLAGQGIGLTTQSYYLITLKSFLKFLRVRKELPVLDPLRIELPQTRRKIIDTLTEKEAERLLAVLPMTNRERTRARAIIEFMIGSGVRVAELCSLKVSQVDLKEKWFRVIGKGERERVCFINDTMVIALKKYLATRKNNTGYLFTQYDSNRYNAGKPLTTRSVQRIIKKYARIAGIDENKCTPHAMRRLFAVRLLRKNVDLRFVQDFLGHQSVQSTVFYTKIERSDLEKIYRLANKKATKDVKEKEMVIVGRETMQKLTGTISRSLQQQNKILKKLEGKEEKPVIAHKVLTVN